MSDDPLESGPDGFSDRPEERLDLGPDADLEIESPASNLNIPDGSDAPSEVQAAFWPLVLLFNVAILAIAIGIMLVGIGGQWRVGGSVFAVGTAAFVVGYYRYRQASERLE